MKLFEVVCEFNSREKDSNEIITERQFVTAEDDVLKAVCDYFTEHCYQFGKELKTVSHVADIVQHIPAQILERPLTED